MERTRSSSASSNAISHKRSRGSVLIRRSSSPSAAAIDQSKQFLSLDVIYNILLRLPVRSLLRFKSVSKPWFRTISDPKFGQDHVLVQSALNELLDAERFILFPTKNYGGYEYPSIDLEFTTHNSYDRDCFKVGARVLTMPLHRQKNLCGSCNGLLLFRLVHVVGHRFVIWNPSTDACTDFFYPCDYQIDDDLSSLMISGLCYDSSLDDYKVVFAIRKGNPFTTPSLAVVYSLKSNSWKEIGEVPYYYTDFGGINSVKVNGALHWLVGISGRNDSIAIVYFDLLQEKFKELPLSECLQKRLQNFNQLALQMGRLCLFIGGRDRTNIRSKNIEVWIMNEYGVGESWVKLFTIPPYNICLGVRQPYLFCFTKNDRLVCVGGDGKAALYRRNQNKWEVISEVNTDHGPLDVTTYVASLVSPSFGSK